MQEMLSQPGERHAGERLSLKRPGMEKYVEKKYVEKKNLVENNLKYMYMSWGLHRLNPEAATGSKVHLFAWLKSAREPFSLNCKN